MKPVIDSVIQYISPSKAQLVDFVDRCCYRYTPLLLVVFVFITGTIDTFGRPMNCMVPSEFTEAWSNYVHQFCYVTGTYLKLYPNGEEQKVYVDYYQWVPFVLIIQAVAMRLPQFFWRSGQSMADIDFPHMHDLCVNIRNSEADKRFENVQKAASYLFQVSKHRGFKTGVGSKATSLYMLSKAMNVIMLLGQIFFLNIFVGKHDLLWGITLARQVWSHKDLSKHVFRYFPRVSYCEFGRNFLGSDPGQMVQEARCTLGINMLNEKVFLVLYFWFYALLLLTVVDLLFRLCRFFGPCSDGYVNDNYLSLVNQNLFFGEHVILVSQDAREVVHFNKHVLGKDGVLLFHFLQQNFGRLIAAEICSTLYHMSQRNRQME